MLKRMRLLVLGGICFLESCDLIEHRNFHDPKLKLQKEDYAKLTQPPKPKDLPLPPCSALPSSAKVPALSPEMSKKISIILSEGVSLRTALVELGRQTGVGMALSTQVDHSKKGVNYSAYNAPFIKVIEDICILTQNRFKVQDNRILIEPDDPYLVVYNIQFLNHTRKSESRISVSTNVFSSVDSKNGTENGSDSILLGHTQMDFWEELTQNLKLILTPKASPASKEQSAYTVHKQGGLIMVLGTTQQHKQIAEYLKKLKEATASQVIIEAKIIEVTLDNAFKSGINWRQLGEEMHFTASLGGFAMPLQKPSSPYAARDGVTFSVEQDQFSTMLNLVKKFGTVRTLSNPRITVLNNQPAMLKVATNEVFFHLEFDRYFQADGKPDVENVSSDAVTVPIGLVMVVQPSINLETREITLILRPTLSRVQKEIEDPAVAIKSSQKVKSTIPVVQVRELDSVLKIKSGQVVVMGGLMEDRSSYMTSSIPIMDSIPFFGEFAKGKEDEQKLTELVIFLTAHIVEDPYIVEADQRLYNTYMQDPRPLQF